MSSRSRIVVNREMLRNMSEPELVGNAGRLSDEWVKVGRPAAAHMPYWMLDAYCNIADELRIRGVQLSLF